MNAHRILAALVILAAAPHPSFAQPAPNVVTDWAAIVQQAIHNASAPRSGGTSQVLQTMVQLAIYDAAVAVQGGYRPYAADLALHPAADVRAAVAAAAYRTARARVLPSQHAYLDQQYASYLLGLPDGPAKTEGVLVGEQVAEAILAARADDGFGAVVPYECSSFPPGVGEFEPDTGCPTSPSSPQPVDVKLGRIQPFALERANQFRPDGPNSLSERSHAEDFAETRDYGRSDSAYRTPDQTDAAYFWSENPYVFWNRNLIALATARGLGVLDAARFLAMTQTAVSDAIIAGFDAKYYYRAWRPRTAIPNADLDGNRHTDADPAWTPLLRVNHPEYPSGHGFWSTALTDAVAAFFGTTRVPMTLVVSRTNVPQVVRTERTYSDVNAVMREVTGARIWGGLHWRQSMQHGAQVGRKVAAYVTKHLFGPVD